MPSIPLPERIDYLTGQINALKCFASAVIHDHPDRARLAEALQRAIQMQKAGTKPGLQPDPFLQGQLDMQNDLAGLFLP